MSARSPRSSLSGSSDVALDFAESLKDLQQNNKWEISNLTTIARESTEHAQAISKALEEHINTAAPSKKLVALYVLDSIVKNVGTPYTVYLGSNLASLFFNAYRLVDPQTRRAMESLFRTWKEPIPGALDRQPVFTPNQTSAIEKGLNQIKAMDVKRQPPVQYGQQQVATPPQYNGQFAVPQMPPQPQQSHPYYNQQSTPQQQSWPPAYPPPTPQHIPVAQPPPYVDINALNADIASLISRIQGRLAANQGDQGLHTQLQALQQLQQLMNTGAVSGQALQDVRNKVSGLAAAVPASVAPTPQPQAHTPQWPPAHSTPQSFRTPPPVAPPYQPPQAVSLPFMQPPSTAASQPPPALFPPGALNGLQALLANGQKPSTPQMRVAAPILQNASHNQLSNVQSNIAAVPPTNPTDLLAALSKSGVLSSLVPPTPATPSIQPPAISAPPPQSTASLLQSLSSIFPPSQSGTPTSTPAPLSGPGKPRIPMLTAELRTFRPELVRALYDNQPNQCSTCGRRFLGTEEGRAKKQRHLDWHFRTNQRLADPALSRGQHRQWFVNESEWISLPDFDPSTASAADVAAGAGAARKEKKGPRDQFVRAPAGVTRWICSICQEEMRSQFSEERGDWVFMNATYYNGKPAHATCVEEMKRPVGGAGGGVSLATALSVGLGQRQRSATPESALGKRKAEGVLTGGQGSRVRNA